MKRLHYGHDQKRMKIEDDRLSNLPDDLLHKILSSIGTKRTIRTSVLASRWRFMWTSSPYLSFSSKDFPTLPKFSKFVTHVLSGRNNKIEVSSVKLSFRGKVTQGLVKRLLKYAFSHNVQRMTVECLEEKTEFPLSVFNSQSLKYLSLIGPGYAYLLFITSLPTWELPALTTLHLDRVTFCDDHLDIFGGLLSKLINLKSLTLKHSKMIGFRISNPKLCTLTLEIGNDDMNVDAPHLKNLSLTLSQNICNEGQKFPNFPNGLPSLENVDLSIEDPLIEDTQEYVRLIQRVHNVKCLKLNLEVVEVFSSSVELFSNQPSTFANLKVLKIYPLNIDLVRKAQMKENVSAVVKNYFLDGSQNATMTMVSREELRAPRNIALAQKHMPVIRGMLDRLKDELNKPIEQAKTAMGVHKAKMNDQGNTNVENQGRMKKIESSWEDLSVQIKFEQSKTSHIFWQLDYIEELFTDIPVSKRGELQASFATLCEEADIVINKLVDRMKFVCEEKQRHLHVYFNDLVKAPQSS